MKNVYSVGQVNSYIRNMFSQDFMLRSIYVRGEVSNCKYHSSGHLYFTLKDEKGSIACVMFSGYRKGLKFRLEEGQQVVALGSVEVYERDGKYQLYAKEIIPDGAGWLYEKFERLKRELAERGLFAPEYKQPVPKYIRTLGVVTAPAGAAVQDIINITHRRNPYVQIILYPAIVQGDQAVPSIVNGIRALERIGVDVMIVGRGGGSIEDLWAFNDERVARAIYESELPVISAVGHEPDVTIADFVADARASTPSNAAEIAVPDSAELLRWLRGAEGQMARKETARLEDLRTRLEKLRAKRVMTDPMAYLQDKRMELTHVQQRLGDVSGTLLSRKKERFAALAASLDAMSPLKVLGRGYAMAQNGEGQILKSWHDVSAGDAVTVTLGEGALACRVEDAYDTKERYGK